MKCKKCVLDEYSILESASFCGNWVCNKATYITSKGEHEENSQQHGNFAIYSLVAGTDWLAYAILIPKKIYRVSHRVNIHLLTDWWKTIFFRPSQLPDRRPAALKCHHVNYISSSPPQSPGFSPRKEVVPAKE